MYLVFEYLETDLEKIINDKKSVMSAAEARNFMKQVLECVAYLHAHEIVHRV